MSHCIVSNLSLKRNKNEISIIPLFLFIVYYSPLFLFYFPLYFNLFDFYFFFSIFLLCFSLFISLSTLSHTHGLDAETSLTSSTQLRPRRHRLVSPHHRLLTPPSLGLTHADVARSLTTIDWPQLLPTLHHRSHPRQFAWVCFFKVGLPVSRKKGHTSLSVSASVPFLFHSFHLAFACHLASLRPQQLPPPCPPSENLATVG
jgi:hypothetical protein